jgi:hypothetical protein
VTAVVGRDRRADLLPGLQVVPEGVGDFPLAFVDVATDRVR